jgi:hypothetical protein
MPIIIPETELVESFIRASGPGGQNVKSVCPPMSRNGVKVSDEVHRLFSVFVGGAG